MIVHIMFDMVRFPCVQTGLSNRAGGVRCSIAARQVCYQGPRQDGRLSWTGVTRLVTIQRPIFCFKFLEGKSGLITSKYWIFSPMADHCIYYRAQ